MNVRLALGMMALVSFATSVHAQAAGLEPLDDARELTNDSPTDPGWVMLESSWRPIITVGYRFQRSQPRSVFVSDEPFVDHGMTVGIVLPVLASGSTTSRVRVALGIGLGVDRAKSRETIPTRGTATTWSLDTYAQLGAILRVAPSLTWGWLATAVWAPGRSSVAFADSRFHTQGWRRTAARGRLTFGVVVRGIHLGLIVGAANWSGDFKGVVAPVERIDLELGLQLGSGW